MASFRVALGGGLVVVVALALLRLFPLALVAAAVLVPLVTVLYVIDVDVYEDEPMRVILFTAAWGVVGGLLVGLLTRAVAPAGTLGGGGRALIQALVLPIVSVAVMLGGPLVLLPYRKFNDVLDGATFGATSAVTFAGASVLTNAFSLFSNGFRPLGPIGPWVAFVLTLGVAKPVLFAGLIGSAAGSLWLRYRAPAKDRKALGLLGNPSVAIAMAVAGAILAALIQTHLSVWLGLVLLFVLAAASMVWLRVVIHVGLREEASEEGLGADLLCANCGRSTPAANFCTRCGVSLLALPKSRSGGSPT
jgi:hypothetical protein